MIRTRKPGDYLTIADGRGGMIHKSLKSYLVDQKIPQAERDRLPILAEGEHVLWVVGYRVLLTEEEVDKRIQEIGEQISKDYAGKQVHLVCVLKGGSFFMCELAKRITVPVSLDFMSVSSYGSDTKSSGVVKIVKDLDESLKDKEVIVVEDIVDSGRTLSYLLEMLKDRGPASLRLCTLLDKPERRVIDVHVDYTGFNIPDEFVVGYGLDYDQRYRNLPYIGVVEFD